jgi:hypothetical protein
VSNNFQHFPHCEKNKKGSFEKNRDCTVQMYESNKATAGEQKHAKAERDAESRNSDKDEQQKQLGAQAEGDGVGEGVGHCFTPVRAAE